MKLRRGCRNETRFRLHMPPCSVPLGIILGDRMAYGQWRSTSMHHPQRDQPHQLRSHKSSLPQCTLAVINRHSTVPRAVRLPHNSQFRHQVSARPTSLPLKLCMSLHTRPICREEITLSHRNDDPSPSMPYGPSKSGTGKRTGAPSWEEWLDHCHSRAQK